MAADGLTFGTGAALDPASDDGLDFDDYIKPPEVPPDPIGDDWRGPPGPAGPPGPGAAPSDAVPLMDGAGAPGTAATAARGDHRHPSDTSRLAVAGGTLTGALTLAADPVSALQPVTLQYYTAHLPSGGGASLAVSDTPPASPTPGMLWWDSVGGQLYLWYVDPNTAQWVAASNLIGGTAGVASFNTRTGAVTLSLADVTGVGGAPLASPVFTGDARAVTPATGDNDTSIATTAFVQGVTHGPAPDTSLDLNFLSGVLDSRIAFTRASTATYFDATGTLQTAATNVPRFDFDPVTHAPLGLLIEEARTNSLLNSGAPATQTTASLATGTYTLWIVGTGSATSSAGTAVGTGFGAATAGTPNVITITTAGTVTVTVAGSPTRFQLENGGFATSYIPTTGATATRAADAATMALPPGWGATLGSWAADFTVEGFKAGSFGRIVAGSNNQVAPIYATDVGRGGTYDGAVTLTTANAFAVNTLAMIASAITGTAGTVCLNGGAVVSGSLTSGFGAITSIKIMGDASGAETSNGRIRRVRYWPRSLSAAELQGVTSAQPSISNTTIDASPIGMTTPAPGAFTSLSASGPLGGQLAAIANNVGRNRVHNGRFQVNQRAYATGTALAAAAYGFDRWKAGSGGCTLTFAASPPATTVTITSGSLQQIVEALNVEGGTYTLSWTGTAQGRVNAGTYAVSPVTVTGLAANTAITAEFNAGTLGAVQLEVGSVATPVEKLEYADDLRHCQRFYCLGRVYASFNNPVAAYSVTVASMLPVTMRAQPTIAVAFGGGQSNFNTPTSTPLGQQYWAAGGTSPAAGYGMLDVTYTASADL
jgi:hypothetical protein